MVTKSTKTKKQKPVQDRIIILSGGGDDIERILKDISSTDIFQNKSVAYVAIAAETNEDILALITNNFANLKQLFQSFGANDVDLITSSQYSDMFKHDLIILSGGDTEHLLNTLQKKCFTQKIKEHSNVQAIIGISAGAIVLAQVGIGTLRGHQHKYQGLGLVNIMVVPHSNPELRKRYSDALHLKEYESRRYNLNRAHFL